MMDKPNIKNSCCALYTTRLDASQFTISKSQRQAMKRFNLVLEGKRPLKVQAHEVEI